ncbi:MAG: hypothetical protein KGJ09_08405 [Candidatus Omnitrophica bacterium]|nr:hypothetical protein [Candidatus Omnitrophota bacterium]MDE2010082.1 hypothetical protein [Candidatus Omnitrophota bacterium]MDE2215178.1 hypothetical protein [Candidatus Omnitrophota bacterium]MDE2232089.1 hypothetical protein [Candidatus Omnitrophota bacterium]
MIKRCALAFLLFFLPVFHPSYAQSGPSTGEAPADAAMEGINIQDTARLLKAEEIILKALKKQHARQERRQHRRLTEQMYDEALNLYRQQRMGQALAAFNKVEETMPDYRSTVAFQKDTNRKAARELDNEMLRIRAMRSPAIEKGLETRALMLYQQAAFLAGEKDSAVVRGKLIRLKNNFRQLSQQVYIRRQLDRIAQEAENFDQEIFRLTQAKDYAAARKKYIEFQQTMIHELAGLKKTVQLRNSLYALPHGY